MKNNRETFTKEFWRYLGIFGIIIILICTLPALLTQTTYCLFNFSDTGQIGDTIGGVMGPFVAIAAAILTFLAFWVQYKANEQQRKDIALERFESNLFELIHIQQDITNNLIFIEKKGSESIEHAKGRDVFQFLYENYNFGMEGKYNNLNFVVGVKSLMKKENIDNYIDLEEVGCLDHYFRHLYRLIKYINDSDLIDKNKKYEYTSIVRASLSQYELIMLFYNCLSSNGREKFKPLIEEYSMFNNLRDSLLAKEEHYNLYSNTAYEKPEH